MISLKSRIALITTLLFLPWGSFANDKTIKEISISGNIRSSKINDDNFQKTFSLTGSLAIYLWRKTALEFSYTQGSSTLKSLPSPTDAEVTIESDFKLLGVDFVTTVSSKDSPVQPYIKLGVAYMNKEISRTTRLGTSPLEPVKGIVPNGGLGLKIKTNHNLYLKVGGDIWASPLGGNQESLDYSVRLGLSLYL